MNKVMDTAPFTLEITQDATAVFHAPPMHGSLDLRLGDCMEVMATFADGHFDLAIVDPPYGIGEDGGKCRTRGSKRTNGEAKGWDKEPHYAGIHLTACEIDADYFHAAKARIARETSQADLFSPHINQHNQ